jgi:hypothetical protein
MKTLFLILLTTFIVCPASCLAGLTDAEALAFLNKEVPSVFSQIAPLEQRDPQDFRSALDEAKEAAEKHAKLIANGETAAAAAAVKMYALDFAAISLADAFLLSTDETEKASLTVKLKARIAESFDQWLIVEQSRLRRLEAELAKLRSEISKAASDKTNVIEKDAASLIEECRQYQMKKKAGSK